MNARKIDLADPAFEPTDEELQELSHRAFAGVARLNEESLERVHSAIREQRRLVLARVERLFSAK